MNHERALRRYRLALAPVRRKVLIVCGLSAAGDAHQNATRGSFFVATWHLIHLSPTLGRLADLGKRGIYWTPVATISCRWRRRVGGDRLLEETIEKFAARPRSPTVEAERELVQAGVQILVTDNPLMSPEQPALQQRGDTMDSRQQPARQLPLSTRWICRDEHDVAESLDVSDATNRNGQCFPFTGKSG